MRQTQAQASKDLLALGPGRGPDRLTHNLVATSMVHVVSALGNLVLAYLLVRFVVTNATPGWLAFPLVGFQATFTYNVLLLLEDFLSEQLVKITPFGEGLDESD